MNPEQAMAAYESMSKAELRKVLVMEYLCAQDRPGCLLLHVWNTPVGRLYCRGRYKVSPHTAITETVETARVKYTEDGFRKWRAHAGSFDEILSDYEDYAENPEFGLPMNCDHLRNVNVTFARLATDANRGLPGRCARYRVARDGTVAPYL